MAACLLNAKGKSHVLAQMSFFAQIKIFLIFSIQLIWAFTLENLSLGFAYNKGTDQPAYPLRSTDLPMSSYNLFEHLEPDQALILFPKE